MSKLCRFFGVWLLALTVTVSAVVPHMATANALASSSQETVMIEGKKAHGDCLFGHSAQEQFDGCASMMAHCVSLLPLPTALPRQMSLQVSAHYASDITESGDLVFFGDTPPPRG